MAKEKKFNLVISSDMHEKLKATAHFFDCSVAAVIRLSVRNYLRSPAIRQALKSSSQEGKTTEKLEGDYLTTAPADQTTEE